MVNYYNEIKEKLLKNEIYAKVKDYSKEIKFLKIRMKISCEKSMCYNIRIINLKKKITN